MFYLETNDTHISVFGRYENTNYWFPTFLPKVKPDSFDWNFKYEDVPLTYEQDGSIISHLIYYPTCEFDKLSIKCGTVPGFEFLMDDTEMVVISDLKSNFNEFYELKTQNFYAMTGNTGSFLQSDEIDLQYKNAKECGLYCTYIDFECSKERPTIKNPI